MSRRVVGIVGLGLIGGSLARSLKREPGVGGPSASPRVLATTLDRDDLERAVADGVVDGARAGVAELAPEVDLLVFATPLDVTLDLLEVHREDLDRAILTDVVSLKAPLERRTRELGLHERWVGGHPMAGSERSGYRASSVELLVGASVFLVRGAATERAVAEVEGLWRRAGANPRWIAAEEHDALMIRASHLPQLVANALAAALAGAGVPPEDLGPGGRDMTRLAASSSELWTGLLGAAGEGEVEGIEEVVRELERLGDLLSSGDLDGVGDYMDRTRRWREGETWS